MKDYILRNKNLSRAENKEPISFDGRRITKENTSLSSRLKFISMSKNGRGITQISKNSQMIIGRLGIEKRLKRGFIL